MQIDINRVSKTEKGEQPIFHCGTMSHLKSDVKTERNKNETKRKAWRKRMHKESGRVEINNKKNMQGRCANHAVKNENGLASEQERFLSNEVT